MRISLAIFGVLAATVAGGAAAGSAGAPLVQERNTAPKHRLLSMRMMGSRVYARVRICDDSRRNVGFFARDSRRGVASYTRRFATRTPPRPCAAYSWSWRPARRFLGRGNYVVTTWARDAGGLTSPRIQTTFLR
jgi:hypothetical protein